jgi:hypothetical protein
MKSDVDEQFLVPFLNTSRKVFAVLVSPHEDRETECFKQVLSRDISKRLCLVPNNNAIGWLNATFGNLMLRKFCTEFSVLIMTKHLPHVPVTDRNVFS